MTRNHHHGRPAKRHAALPQVHGEGPYARLAAWAMANRALVLVSAVLLGLVSAFIGLPPDVDANILALLPKDDPSAMALRRIHEEEGGANLVNMVFSSEDPVKLDAALDDLAQRFEALDDVEFALHEVDPDLAFRLGLMSLPPDDLAMLNDRMSGALLLGSAASNPFIQQKLMAMGPVTERIAAAGDLNLFKTADGRARMVIRPTGSSLDPLFCERLMVELDQTIADANLGAQGVSHDRTAGVYFNTVQDLHSVRSDVVNTSLISGVLVLGILIIAFRSLRALILVFPPLILANLVNLAICELTIGSLNTYTSFGTAVLIGLGIDFAVHLVGRYRELRLQGVESEPAVRQAWDLTGPACTTAALTSAGGFLALAVAHFRGFYQLGVVLAVGLMLCLAFMLVLLPVLLPILDPKPSSLFGSREIPRSQTSTYHLAPAGLMAAVIVTVVVGVSNLPDSNDFEYDLSAMRRDGFAYDELSEADRALARDSYSPVILSFTSDEALADGDAVVQRAIDHDVLKHVSKAMSIRSLLPLDQSLRLAQLDQLAKHVEDPNFRYLPPPIVKQLIKLRGFEAKPITAEDLPSGVRALLGAGQGKHRLLLFPKGNMWDLRQSEALLSEVEEVLREDEMPAGTWAAGEFLAQGALFRAVKVDMPRVGIVALLLVTLLTAMDLRRFSRVAVAMSVLGAGMLWSTVAIQAAGVKLSMVNIVGVPILLGIGVDVVIHLLHRLEEEGPGGVKRALYTTGVAATISTVTTVASFLSLLDAGHRGVRGLGILVVIGLSTVFIVTAALLPLAWSAGWRITGRAPGHNRER